MAALAFRPLAPGVRLMRRMRISSKLALLGCFLVLPIAYRAVTFFAEATRELSYSQRERVGAAQVDQLVEVVHAVQGLRDQAFGGAEGVVDTARQKANVKSAVEKLDGTLLSADDKHWAETRQALNALLEGRLPEQRNERFRAETRLVQQLQTQLELTAEASGLLLDPQTATYFLMDIAVGRMVPWLEALSVARGQGAAIVRRGEATHADRAAMLGTADRVERQLEGVQLRLDALARGGVAVPAGWPAARDASKQLVEQVRHLFSGGTIDADPVRFFAGASEAMRLASEFDHKVDEELATALDARIAQQGRMMVLKIGAASLGMAVIVYLALSFYFSFSGAIRALHRGVDHVASGDLSQRIVVEGRDELAEIGAMVERMNERLSSLVAEIRSSAVRVTMSGEQVADGSQSLASRTEQQAASLRQTVATVQHLSAAVAANAAEANELDRLTAQLREQAEAGGDQMRGSVEAMSKLEDSSRRVAEIIGVIDAIAFQTNILALNAAVEAARAGEAGRGFAVVASEVRTLAQRSAEAAREIRSLIARSSEQVDSTVQSTRVVGTALSALVDGVRRVSQSLQSIAQASASQSTDLQEVTASVGNLDEITRRNAEMVEQSARAAGDLVERAGTLRESVAMIKLRQGSADEARSLVERALELVRSQGLAGAGPALHSREQGFVDRDLYVFVVDRAGRYLLHGAKPAMEGHRVHEVPGIDGDRFVREAWAAAQSNDGRGGWVEYDIVNPESGAVQPKASFVVPLDDQQIIGCGIYRVGGAART